MAMKLQLILGEGEGVVVPNSGGRAQRDQLSRTPAVALRNAHWLGRAGGSQLMADEFLQT